MARSLTVVFALFFASCFVRFVLAFKPANKSELQEVVNQWLQEESMAKARYGHIRSWDTSMVTDMSMLFENATTFNGEVGSWNTSQVTNMSQMFKNAVAFNQEIGRWDTGRVTDMSWMFAHAQRFNQDIGAWNTSSLTNMCSMFANASRFNQKIGNWSTERVTDMAALFDLAPEFNEDIGGWNTERVVDMSLMFKEARSFNQEIGSWNTGTVTNMSWMFAVAKSFDQQLRGWNTARVVDMSFMFFGATLFNQEIGSWNTIRVANMSWMFGVAVTFNREIGNWNTEQVTDTSFMFMQAAAFNQEIGMWDVGRVTNLYATFGYATSFNQALRSWNTSNVRDMSYLFSHARSFDQDITSWNTGRVTNMTWMFESAYAFNQEIGSWNTANVTDMSSMFRSAIAFNRSISGWDVESVSDMTDMFCGADSFSFLKLLRESWSLAPASCGSATRVSQEMFSVDTLPRKELEHTRRRSLWPLVVCVSTLLWFMFALFVRKQLCMRDPATNINIPDSAQRLLDGASSEIVAASQNPILEPFVRLSITEVHIGQYVRVTTSEEVLRSGCYDASLPFEDRCKCSGALGLVLHIDELDYLAWVAVKTPTMPCQGWFPVACLQDAGKRPCPDVGLRMPVIEDTLKSGIYSFSEVPSPASSMAASTGLATSWQSLASSLRRATLDWHASHQGLQYLYLDQENLLGSGTFGATWVGTLYSVDQTRTKKVAAKLPKQTDISDTDKKNFEEEAHKLARVMLPGGVPHPFLIHFLAYVPEQCAIVMELCEGDLHWFRSTNSPGAALSAAEQVMLMEQAGTGCAWIAEKKLVHRDLKMQNILVARKVEDGGKETYIPKVADFGLAEQSNALTNGVAGTRAYMAPEAQLGRCTEKSDVYSFGHVMLRTFYPNRVCYTFSEDGEVVKWLSLAWKQVDEEIHDWGAKDAASCICNCLHSKAQERSSFVDIVATLARLRISLEGARSGSERV